MVVDLEVSGPFRINTTTFYNKKIAHSTFKQSFEDNDALELSDKKGCYIFCLRFGDKYTPWYVGKATKTFNQECFAGDKYKKYKEALNKRPKSSPYMFFVTRSVGSISDKRIASFSDKRIAEVEKYLIQKASRVNEDLLNIHHAKERDWRILGVMNRTKGKPTDASSEFKTALDIRR